MKQKTFFDLVDVLWFSFCLFVINRPLSLTIISEPLCNALRPGMVLKSQELVCLEWASRKSEWENSAILKSTSAITLAANHAAKNYYRISFDEPDVAFTDALIDQAHNPMVSKTTIEDILNNNDVVESMMSYAVIEDHIVTVT